MGDTPTKTASAGTFKSMGGEDLIQFINREGNVVLWIDCDGVLHIVTTAMQGGSSIQSGVPSE